MKIRSIGRSSSCQFLQLAVGAGSLPFLNRATTAQEFYPSRPIRLIVGFTPGTAADITARAFSNGASDLLGQQVVVEDKPGRARALLPNMSPAPPRMAIRCSCRRLGSPYRSGRSAHWVKVKTPKAPAVTREAEEDWGR
jgi:hypothetical protein